MKIFWKIAKWFVVVWIVFGIFAFSLHIWNSCKWHAYNTEKILMNHCAKFVFFEYWDKGSLPLKVDDCEWFGDWMDKKERERFIYRMIDAESNVFTISTKKIEQTMFFKIINGTTNEPVLTKIEGEDLIQIREFYSNKEGTEKDK